MTRRRRKPKPAAKPRQLLPEHLVCYIGPDIADPAPTASQAAWERWETLHREHYAEWQAEVQRWREENDAGDMAEAIATPDEPFDPEVDL